MKFNNKAHEHAGLIYFMVVRPNPGLQAKIKQLFGLDIPEDI